MTYDSALNEVNRRINTRTTREDVLNADSELRRRYEADLKDMEAHGGRVVRFTDPGREAVRLAHEYMDKNPGKDLKYSYQQIFKMDPKLYQEYNTKTAVVDKHPRKSKETGGDTGGQSQDASKEALDRGRELVRKYRGTGLVDDTKAALKKVFKDICDLFTQLFVIRA